MSLGPFRYECYISIINNTKWNFHPEGRQGSDFFSTNHAYDTIYGRDHGRVTDDNFTGRTYPGRTVSEWEVAYLHGTVGVGRSDLDWINYQIAGYPSNSSWGIRFKVDWDGEVHVRVGWLPHTQNHSDGEKMVEFSSTQCKIDHTKKAVMVGTDWTDKEEVVKHEIKLTFDTDDMGGPWSDATGTSS